jgi:hypothetical protein
MVANSQRVRQGFTKKVLTPSSKADRGQEADPLANQSAFHPARFPARLNKSSAKPEKVL